jgi:outer membrane biosynthesis protein TonB
MRKFLFACILGAALVSCKNEASKEAEVAEATTEAPSTTEATAAPTTDMSAPTGDLSVPTTAAATPSGPTTSIKFDEMEYDFGTVKDGEKVTKIFKFKNTGSQPLVISNATGSCGCTVPEWPKQAIAPNNSGEIKVVFDSTGKGTPEGNRQSKTVDITANTDPVTTNLRIFGTVKSDAKPN